MGPNPLLLSIGCDVQSMVDTANSKDNRKWLMIILALGVLVRLVVVFVFFGTYTPEHDAGHWHAMAQNFLSGRGLLVDENKMAYRTPLPALYFAAIYAVFGTSILAVQIANIVLGVCTVWLVYDLVSRCFGVLSARWAALFASFYPPILLYTAQLLSETPVLMLIALTLWLVWLLRGHSGIWFILVGIVSGLAVLTRQSALAVAVFIAVWTVLDRRRRQWLSRVSPALFMLAFLALTVAPWTLRNYVVLGEFVPLTSGGGISLWIANNPKADGAGVENVPSTPHLSALPESKRGPAYQRLAMQYIRENPGRFAQLSLRRLIYFWHLGYHGEGAAEVVFLVIYLPMLGLAAVGCWAGWRFNRNAVLLLLSVPVTLTVVHMVFLPVGRYRLPAELIVCMFAGVGIALNASKVIKRLRAVKFALEKRRVA